MTLLPCFFRYQIDEHFFQGELLGLQFEELPAPLHHHPGQLRAQFVAVVGLHQVFPLSLAEHPVHPGNGLKSGRDLLIRSGHRHQHPGTLAQLPGEVFRGVAGHDLAPVDDDHPVAQLAHLRQDVAAQHHRVGRPPGS